MKRLLVFLFWGGFACMPRGVDAASAESLFQRGSKALVAGKFEEAIGYSNSSPIAIRRMRVTPADLLTCRVCARGGT